MEMTVESASIANKGFHPVVRNTPSLDVRSWMEDRLNM